MPHSPAPWRTVDGTVFSPGVGAVAHVERSNPNHLADKTLILAAPDMLAALQLTAELYGLHPYNAKTSRLTKREKQVINTAISTAIAAALGIKS
ncbi:hypothetical protein ABIE87_006483 [Bradyrhizobium diazoefficiens]